MVPFATASSTCKPGTISPAAKVSIVNLPSLISLTNLATVGDAPHKPSIDLGKLDASRQLTVGCCATAGEAAAAAAAAAAALAALRRAKFRRETIMIILPCRGFAADFAGDLFALEACRRRSRIEDSKRRRPWRRQYARCARQPPGKTRAQGSGGAC